jgi:hypothetical protein
MVTLRICFLGGSYQTEEIREKQDEWERSCFVNGVSLVSVAAASDHEGGVRLVYKEV